MCGICGIADFAGESVRRETIETMVAAIRHRGPDSAGVYARESIGLGHARLSILDLSPTGRQPMLSNNEEVVLVYNGEIYNHPEIRRELLGKGYEFSGSSDTETILNAYLEWGTVAFAKLDGMFAFALWDARTGTLYLVRDRFGIKPLYYCPLDSGIVFASEVKSMLASGRMRREIDSAALSEYMYYGSALGGRSLFKGIRKLLPGHMLAITASGIEESAFASIYDVGTEDPAPGEAAGRVQDLLDGAVRSHLISDVPVGVFLSGGIDSSAITAFASRHYDGRLATYSVGFDFDKGVNELPKARRVAEHFGTDHHELHIEGKHMPATVEQLVRCHDEPFGDPANLPLFLLCEALKGSVKVVLQGDGGDEVFAGYRRYDLLSRARAWRLAGKLGRALGGLVPKSASYYRYMRLLDAMRQDDPGLRMALLLTEETLDSPPTQVLSDDAQARIRDFDPFSRYRDFQDRFAELDPVQRMLFTDCGVILPDIFLEKVDKATMAHGIEVRVPLLDNRLAHYVMSLPARLKVRPGQKKWLLRQALRGVVPDDILDAPKTGFGVPTSHWLRSSMAGYLQEVLFDPGTERLKLFDRKRLEACVTEHLEGRRNNGFLLYKLLQLVLWHRFYIA